MIPKKLEEIAFEDIRRLVSDEVRESRTLEYKRQLPHEGESSKIPFLAEISAFANTDGGDLVFGVIDEKGVPTELCGVEADDPDKEILRLENVILSGIEPRIPAFSTSLVGGEEKAFLVIRIGKSWNAPHRVIFREHAKFYKRNSAGKYPMDVTELRTAFLQSEHIVDRIRNFRLSRVGKLREESELPVLLHAGAKIVLHLIPLSAVSSSEYISFDARRDVALSFRPMGASGWNNRYNLDGIVTFTAGRNDHPSTAYTQIFRSGIVEAVSSLGWYGDEK